MNNKMEMSKLDSALPRWYKGYDLDELMQKENHNIPLTEREKHILSEAQDIYYEIEQKKNRQQMELFLENCKGKLLRCQTLISNPQTTNNRTTK